MGARKHAFPVKLLDLATVATLAGVEENTIVRYNQAGEGPPRDPETGKYPARELGEWLRKEFIKRPGRGSKPDRPLYPHGPAGWGPLSAAKPIPRLPSLDDSDTSVSPLDKTVAEVRLKTAQAVKVERENEVEAGRLIPVDDVEAAWSTILDRVKRRLRQLPSGTAMLVLGDADLYSVQGKLQKAVDKALIELSERWQDDKADDEGEPEDD